MKKRITINKNDYYISAYNTFQELKLIEFIELNDDLTDEDYRLCAVEFLNDLDVCPLKKSTLSQISDIELVLLLLKVREFTIGADVKLRLNCTETSCNKQIPAEIDISKIYKNAERDNTFEECNFVSAECMNNIDESIIPEDTDWDVYEDIKDNLDKYYSIYNLNFTITCPYCKNVMTFRLNTVKKALTFMSEESLRSIMSVIHDLAYFGNITRSDVMQMTPLERLIEISLLKKTKEKQNAQNTQNNVIL